MDVKNKEQVGRFRKLSKDEKLMEMRSIAGFNSVVINYLKMLKIKAGIDDGKCKK